MDIVTVNKDTLLKKLRENRDGHRAAYEEAMDGYQKVAIKEISAMLEDAKAGRPVAQFIDLPLPQDHTKDYDTAIEMLDWSLESELKLTRSQFQQYVQDDWSWKQEFMTTSSNYLSSL